MRGRMRRLLYEFAANEFTLKQFSPSLPLQLAPRLQYQAGYLTKLSFFSS